MNTDSNKQFFILIGRSGSGKSTQTALLTKYLEEKIGGDVVNITTGSGFREFISQDNYISKLASDLNSKGVLQPEFLAIWNWTNIFIEKIKGGETIILDGAPRKLYEVQSLHSAINLMGYKNPKVIYLDTSEDWAVEKIKSRGREDDKEESSVDNKMNWFEVDVLPALDAYIHDPRYTYIHVNGEQTIEEVNREIIEKLNSLTKND